MTGRRLIHIAGALTALLLVPHFLVPLGWGDALSSLTRDERAIMYELAYGFAVLLALVAYLSLRHADELLTTRIGRPILVGIIVFWIARAVEGITLGEDNAIPIAVMRLGVAVLYGIALAESLRSRPLRPRSARQTTSAARRTPLRR